jgi:hypothetical protein
MTCHINLNKQSALKRMHFYFRDCHSAIDYVYLWFNLLFVPCVLEFVRFYWRGLFFLVSKFNCIGREKNDSLLMKNHN